jgi:hypothetical protein
VLADVGFFLDAQLRAAQARGQPSAEAVSFAEHTLESLTRLAAQHRREALVAAVVRSGCSSVRYVEPALYIGVWHLPLEWDDECDQMLVQRLRGTTAIVPAPPYAERMRWLATVEIPCRAASASSSERAMTLRGEWLMQWLRSQDAICKEGREQHNCLRHEDGRFLSTSREASYWSLRFTPDAVGAAQLEADEHLCRAASQLRLTVHVEGSCVREAKAARNAEPPLAALQALAEWGRRASVRVPQYNSKSSDGNAC